MSTANPTGRLVLGAPDDPAEREAHRAADAVAAGGTARILPGVRPVRPLGSVDPVVRQRIARACRGGRPLPDADRVPLERAFGTDLGEVRLHVGAEADVLCRAVRARAFTVGRHVFVGAGYRPGSADTRRVLAHEVAHVLQDETGVLRRLVRDGGGAELTEAKVLQGVRAESGGQLHVKARAAGVDVDTLIKSFVDSEEGYHLADVYQELRRLIDAATFQEDIPMGLPGVGLRYRSIEADGIDQQFAAVRQPDRLDVYPGRIRFRAGMAVQLGARQVGEWTLGLVQNVLQANRVITFSRPDQTLRTVTMTIAEPTCDRGEDGVAPWYDTHRSSARLDLEYQEVDVVLDDRPGFWLTMNPGEQLHDMSGFDLFRTWLVVRRDTDGQAGWLYRWDWGIDYEADGGAVVLTDQGWYPDGTAAVLDGPRASYAIVTREMITDHECC